VRLVAIGCRSLILKAILFGLWVLDRSMVPAISDDNVLVADWTNSHIQVFDQNGILVKTIETGQLSYPCGVWMDHEGRIIVAEGVNRISIF